MGHLRPEALVFDKQVDSLQLVDLGTFEPLTGKNCKYLSPEEYFQPHRNIQLAKHHDIWAFGCILLHFITGLEPFHNLEQDEIANILKDKEKGNPYYHV